MAIDWKTLGENVAKIGLPLLGAVLPVPGGAAIGTALASAIGSKSANPQDILDMLTSSAEAVEKAKQFELTHQETMLKLQLDNDAAMRAADSADLATVNATMQAEAANSANENWFQKGWRPFNGYVVGLASFVAVVFVCVLFYQAMSNPNGSSIASVCAQIPALAFAIAAILGVPGAAVGITAWHKGMLQRNQAQGQ